MQKTLSTKEKIYAQKLCWQLLCWQTNLRLCTAGNEQKSPLTLPGKPLKFVSYHPEQCFQSALPDKMEPAIVISYQVRNQFSY